MREEDLKSRFPGLREGAFRITSPETQAYNCLAWAGGVDSSKWYPDPWDLYYWPEADGEDSLEGWVRAYGALGFDRCEDGAMEAGYTKVAIYGFEDAPLHIARQLPSGLWTSKLGDGEDIEHELSGLIGEKYGEILIYMRREQPS